MVSGGFDTLEHGPEEKGERMMYILFTKKTLNLFASASSAKGVRGVCIATCGRCLA